MIRRTSRRPDDRPRVRESASSGAGCHAGFPVGLASAGGANRLVRVRWAGELAQRLDREPRTGLTAPAVGSRMPESRDCELVASLNSNCVNTAIRC